MNDERAATRLISPDLCALAAAVGVHQRNGFTIGPTATVIDDPTELQAALTNALYETHYCRPTRARGPGDFGDVPASRELLARYSRANVGRGTFDAGWRLVSVEPDGRHVVTRYGLTFWAAPEHVQRAGDDDAVRVAIPKEFCELVHGYYMFFGNAPGNRHTAAGDIARLYFHVTERGGTDFVDAVSRILNSAELPFRAKVISIPGHFFRADSGVLYLARADIGRAAQQLREIHRALRRSRSLRDSTPMLTFRLAPGLAIADDPGPMESFGAHRCQLVARGLLASYRDAPPTEHERLAGVVAAFEAAGLSAGDPHLHHATSEPFAALFDEESTP